LATPRLWRRLAWLGLIAVLGLANGCGYALAGSGLGGVGSVAIRTPENGTHEPGAEYVVADALRRELLRRQGGSLVEDPARADVVVSGRVLDVRSRSRAFSSAVLAREYDLVVRVALRAVRRDGTELLEGGNSFSETERYLASADVEAQRKNRDEALRRVSGLLAARFFDSLGEALP
jgi:outer membrane lipopolysaccharide assembly protein LptE/RlpB